MITICTVTTDTLQQYAAIMLDSIICRTQMVSEVKIAKPDSDENLDEKWEKRGIKFHLFGCPVKDSWYGHPLGLHACIEKATNEYLFFCDPDIFFYSPVEKIYLDLMNKYDINYIGVSHHASVIQAHTYFPVVVNSMIKKSDLPSADWMKGELKYRTRVLHSHELSDDDDYELADGKYLIESPLPKHYHKFPNKDLKYAPYYFDVGCNLWLWGQEKKWKWLAFQTTDCHNYSTIYNRGNLKIEKLPKTKLIYHVVGASNHTEKFIKEHLPPFIDAYQSSKVENND